MWLKKHITSLTAEALKNNEKQKFDSSNREYMCCMHSNSIQPVMKCRRLLLWHGQNLFSKSCRYISCGTHQPPKEEGMPPRPPPVDSA
mmetsp:Transcript_39815/g.58589  ORF Transcript_39815/g.58589 Transcript_39815/m.58589 type:complete len:88 (+) Transcript_39815:309-572(+)